MAEMRIGDVLFYEGSHSRGFVELLEPLSIGDVIRIKGAYEDFIQTIESMQIEFMDVQQAKSGDSVCIKVQRPVRPHDEVYKVI